MESVKVNEIYKKCECNKYKPFIDLYQIIRFIKNIFG
jgi:hypothetical protein